MCTETVVEVYVFFNTYAVQVFVAEKSGLAGNTELNIYVYIHMCTCTHTLYVFVCVWVCVYKIIAATLYQPIDMP